MSLKVTESAGQVEITCGDESVTVAGRVLTRTLSSTGLRRSVGIHDSYRFVPLGKPPGTISTFAVHMTFPTMPGESDRIVQIIDPAMDRLLKSRSFRELASVTRDSPSVLVIEPMGPSSATDAGAAYEHLMFPVMSKNVKV
jgi:hypothetical protein